MSKTPHAKDLEERSRFVYDAHTGHIVHSFHFGAPRGTALPTDRELDERAIAEAARLTGRDAKTLAALAFDRSAIKTGVAYSVHPAGKHLVEGGPHVRPPFAGLD
jgi:hypothetical protein